MKKSNVIERILSFAIFTALLCSFSFLTTTADNGMVAEKEGNDSFAAANVIRANQAVKGSLSDMNDDDYFVFTAPSNGHLHIVFSHVYSTDSDRLGNRYYWYAEIYHYNTAASNYENIGRSQIKVDSAEKITVRDIGVSHGDKYYLKIYSGMSTDAPYNVDFEFDETDTYEKENNGSFALATPIGINERINGNLGSWSGSDYDYFKLTPATDSEIQIIFNHTYGTEKQNFYVRLYNYVDSDYTAVEQRKTIPIQSAESQVVYSGRLKAGVNYYLEVYAGSYLFCGFYSIEVKSQGLATTQPKEEHIITNPSENNTTNYKKDDTSSIVKTQKNENVITTTTREKPKDIQENKNVVTTKDTYENNTVEENREQWQDETGYGEEQLINDDYQSENTENAENAENNDLSSGKNSSTVIIIALAAVSVALIAALAFVLISKKK